MQFTSSTPGSGLGNLDKIWRKKHTRLSIIPQKDEILHPFYLFSFLFIGDMKFDND